MQLTNEDFEDTRGAMLRLQAKAMKAANARLCDQLSSWLYELETQRWVSTKSLPKEPIGMRIHAAQSDYDKMQCEKRP